MCISLSLGKKESNLSSLMDTILAIVLCKSGDVFLIKISHSLN